MIKYGLDASSLEDTMLATEAHFRDAYGACKEIKAVEVGSFFKWRMIGGISTIYDLPESQLLVSPGTVTSAGSIEVVGTHLHVGGYVHGMFISIVDSNSMISNVPAIDVARGKKHIYTDYRESTTLEDPNKTSDDTVQLELIKFVEKTIDRLFESAGELYFEDGMETDFSRELISLVKKYGNLAMSEISYLISYGKVDDEVAGEALRWLARINDPSTYGWRLWLLEKSLSSDSPTIRDGAALGLVSMHDAHAIQYIRKAIEQETITELHYDLEGALKELEVFLDAAPTTGNKQD